jgi:CRISPR-associated protein Cas2
MVVVILEKVTPGVRGELTRWMLELKAGVFVGDLSAMVRDTIWKMLCKKVKSGAGILAQNAANEQGFDLRFFGDTSREIEDFEGLKLIRIKQKTTVAE